MCNVTPPVVRRWRSLGWISEPPWTLEQLHQIRDETDPQGRRRGPQTGHGTLIRWTEGCDCDQCRRAQNDAARARGRARAQARLPVDTRQHGLTSNQVFGLARADEEWSSTLEAALMASRRDDLQHGTNAAYVAGCVCGECRAHQRIRMTRNRN